MFNSNSFNTTQKPNPHSQQVIKNKGFLLLHEDFTKAGWYLAENEFNHIIYEKEGYKCNQFTIDIFENYIKVNVPIGNTNYSYSTKFAEYFRAQEFILMHLNAIEETMKERFNKKREDENETDHDENPSLEEDTN